jgi:hypothetical protein
MSEKDPEPRPRMTLLRWALPVAGVVVLGLAAAVVVLFIRGSGTDPATPAAAAAEAPRGPSAEYVTAVQGPLGRLTDSAQVTGRVLTRASGEDDVARVGRMATQQLTVVQNARARIADIETGPRERTARGALSRATQAHRTYLASLARLADADAETAPDRVPQIRTQARRMLERYRLLFTELPTVPKGITTAGVGDLTGLRQALTARQRAAERAAEEAEAAERAAEEAEIEEGADWGGSASGEPGGGPVVSNVATTDRGSFVEVSASYCDRTPGAVNDFDYTFRIVQGGRVLAENGYAASQSRACNDLYQTFEDSFPLGAYEVQVLVDNRTNNVSGSGVGSLSVIN